jgi:hypothetical protein
VLNLVGTGQFLYKIKEVLKISRKLRKKGSASETEEKKHQKQRKISTRNKGKEAPRKSSYKVDKLLWSS